MIRQGNNADKEILMRMWKYCFPQDTEHFIQFYFDKVYVNEETLVYTENEQPVASLQIIPYRIKTNNHLCLAGYISGAMTHPCYRKKGYMNQLMQASFDEMIKKNYDYAFLIPQEKELINMYAKYGFRLCKPNPNPPKNIVMKSPEQWAFLQQNFSDEKGIWLENEPVIPNEHKGMIKRLNPAVEEITTLYIGMMLD